MSSALQRVDVAGGLAVDEMEHRVVVLLGVLVHILRFLEGLLGGVAAQNRVQAGNAGLQRLLAQLIDAVAVADDAADLTGIGSGQAHDLAVLVQIRHGDAEAVGIGANGFDIFFNDAFCLFLWIFHVRYPSLFILQPN